MPFYPPFNLPFFSNYRFLYNNYNSNKSSKNNTINSYNYSNHNNNSNSYEYKEKKVSTDAIETPETFFEIFGLKMYFDDILIICILYFLYTEKIKDEELFICLILLLLS